MAHRRNRVRYLDEISSLGELRQARRAVDMQLQRAEERIAEDVAEIFSLDNLLSIIAPPGSVAEGIVGKVGTWAATLRGIINGIRMFRNR